MEDEYGEMNAEGQTFTFPGTWNCEYGDLLTNPQVRYNTYGSLNEARDNAIVVCHALTGNASVDAWWGEILGSGKVLDTDRYMVVCCNVLGSCYGSTGPLSIDPSTGEEYGDKWPEVTIRDTVRLHMEALKQDLGVKSVAAVVGGSLGGMQVLEWLLCGGPEFVRAGVAIGCGAAHSAWQIAISETQRQSVALHNDPEVGLQVARMIAMVSYRTKEAYDRKFGRLKMDNGKWQVMSYLQHQGKKFNSRFDPASYVAITRLMDTHDVGRDRGGVEAALGSIKQPTLIMGISSDVLYPYSEQEELARLIPGAHLIPITSDEGHDGFLLEYEQVSAGVKSFIAPEGLGSIAFVN